MGRSGRTAALAAALALLAVLAACKPAAEAPRGRVEIGAAVAVDPDATIATPPAPATVAKVADPVFAEDRLTTGPDGAIRVRFADATAFSMGANASMSIDSFVYDPNRDASSMSLNFTKGAFRFASGGPLHKDAGQVPVKTPVATIGIRGTALTGVIGPEAEALWQAIDASYRLDGGSTEQATLILLGDGGIDVKWGGKTMLLDMPGQALFFRRPGTDPLGPLLVTEWRRGQIEALGSPPSLGGAAPPTAPTPGPSAAPTPRTPAPSASPTRAPTPAASPVRPTPVPSVSPSASPRPWPTARPTTPRPEPTARPTYRPPTTRPTPTARPTYRPPGTDTRPTPTPTPRPSPRPTSRPPVSNATPRPTSKPTPRPTLRPPVTRATLAPNPRPRPTPAPTGRKPIG